MSNPICKETGLHIHAIKTVILTLPGDSAAKKLPVNAGNWGSIPGLLTSPGEGNGNPLQYSCLENPTDRGA